MDRRRNDDEKSERRAAEELKEKISRARANAKDTSFAEATKSVPEVELKMQPKPRRVLKGHFAKVYACGWGNTDYRHVVSASQDGKLIVWNAFSGNKVHAIPLRSTWVMTCAYSDSGNFVACGGLDNICSVYNVKQRQESPLRVTRELQEHTGYVSCCRFIGDERIITSSGDTSCVLWDLNTGKVMDQFGGPKSNTGHSSDVMSVSVSSKNSNLFVSGGCDTLAKLWDTRTDGSVLTFARHRSDINAIQFLPNGMGFVTGSDDSSISLFDIRAWSHLAQYNAVDNVGVTSVSASESGRFLFGGYDNFNSIMWDSLKQSDLASLAGHDNRVSCLGVSPDGTALCTGSWDSFLKIWA